MAKGFVGYRPISASRASILDLKFAPFCGTHG